MINKKDVEHIASLARLQLSEKEEDKFQKDLASVLGYIEKLKELDVAGVEPTTLGGGLDNIMRKDEPAVAGDLETATSMLKQTPSQKDGYLKVKSILSKNAD